MSKIKLKLIHKLFILSIFLLFPGFPQSVPTGEILNLIQAFKTDGRGPYQAIRWFCPDGRVLAADERCDQPGALQHALPKAIVQKIAYEQGIYLGQILAGTPFADFFDSANQNSRMKQYQLEKYLRATDDGWIMRRGRFYRGAVQAEDEAGWGVNFLTALLQNDEILISQFFLVRQVVKDIPHHADEDRWQSIRALSKTIADSFPAFMNIRVKLHGQPEAEDLKNVKEFRSRYQQTLSVKSKKLLQKLEEDLELAYQLFNFNSLSKYISQLPADSPITNQIEKLQRLNLQSTKNNAAPVQLNCKSIAEILWSIRHNILSAPSAGSRLALLDLSLDMESLLYRTVNSWKAETIADLLEKNYVLGQAVAGCGYLEKWEWQASAPLLQTSPIAEEIGFEEFREKADYARRMVEWGTSMIRAIYGPVVELYSGFEPLAAGFIDDRVRASILLPLGDTAGKLREIAQWASGTMNDVMGIENQGQIQGVNPGFAAGELAVITGSSGDITFLADKIYVLQRAPKNLKPVAGIIAVSEGNLVSHVQLLARNLGIPNALIAPQNLNDLLPYSGQSVFYAVSPGGLVTLKPVSAMTAKERALVSENESKENKIKVPLEKINLRQTELISLRDLRAADSGHLCGPKAANLGELKALFPDKVAEGIVIPFGIFRRHFDQPMPGSAGSYWEFLQQTFVEAKNKRENGASELQVENDIMLRLWQLRMAVKKMPFLPEFSEMLRHAFLKNFGMPPGRQAVFIRSDTNMEDLKEFTGAGLNLTLFNVLSEEMILQGIRDVWASPYTERSYRWRQKYLVNPENLYPSIVILPTVNVEKSGVMITTGVSSSDSSDITIAFNRGTGGAVEGQAAESYLLRRDGQNRLLSPGREIAFTILPMSGATTRGFAHFHQPLLTPAELGRLRVIAAEITRKLSAAPGIERHGPWDVELGFAEGKIWLFQVRPYVENKRVRYSNYLRSLDRQPPVMVRISLDKKIF